MPKKKLELSMPPLKMVERHGIAYDGTAYTFRVGIAGVEMDSETVADSIAEGLARGLAKLPEEPA